MYLSIPFDMIEIRSDCVIKWFYKNLKGLQNEIDAYQRLEGSGVTPKLLEYGASYLKIERYDCSLAEALERHLIDKKQYHVIYTILVSHLQKMNQMGVIHHDLCPRNVVCRNHFTEVAIIDFERSHFESSQVENFTIDWWSNF